MQKLYGEHEYTYVDLERTNGMDFVQKYLRLKHAILFKISNDVLQVSRSQRHSNLMFIFHQFNFYDHTKLILSHRGHVVSLITKDDILQRYFLADIIAKSSIIEDTELLEKLMTKLKYCRQVLREIRKGEVVIVKPATSTSAPGSNLESAAPNGTAEADAASSGLRVQDIGRKALSSTSSKLAANQIR